MAQKIYRSGDRIIKIKTTDFNILIGSAYKTTPRVDWMSGLFCDV